MRADQVFKEMWRSQLGQLTASRPGPILLKTQQQQRPHHRQPKPARFSEMRMSEGHGGNPKSEGRRPNRNTAWSRMIFIILFYCSGHSSKSCIRQEQLDRE